MTEEEKKRLINMGALRYPISKIVSIMNIEDVESFKKAMIDPLSEESKLYKRGADESDYMIDLKLLEMSKGGDLKAIQLLRERQAPKPAPAKHPPKR